MTKTQVRERPQFKQVGDLFISEQSANHSKSMDILKDNALRPITYQEALSHASELIQELKGKWFYLAAGETIKEGGLYTFDKHGELTKLTGKETYDQQIRVNAGNEHQSLFITSVSFFRRFCLSAGYSDHIVAPVVVGVKIDSEAPDPFLQCARI